MMNCLSFRVDVRCPRLDVLVVGRGGYSFASEPLHFIGLLTYCGEDSFIGSNRF